MERDQLGEVSVEGMTILKYIFEGVGCGGVYWIDLTQDMDNSWALLKTAVNLRVL